MAPGPVNTAQFQRECMEDPSQYWRDCQATTAMRRPVEIDGVARGILFLASENWSGYVTGQTLNIDSGKCGKLLWDK